MFERVTIRGGPGRLLWGHRPVADLSAWTIRRTGRTWTLSATVTRTDPFGLRQKGLLFTAPRDKGFWAWGVESVQIGAETLRATLGPPEQ